MIQPIAAGHQDQYVGRGLDDLLPIDVDGSATGRPQHVLPTGQRHHLRHPMPADHQRIEPFEADDAAGGATGGPNATTDPIDAMAQCSNDRLRHAFAIRRLPDGDNRVEHALDARRLKREDLRLAWQRACDLQHILVGDGANRAEFLSQDEVRFELREELDVQLVDRFAAAQVVAHQTVDFGAVGHVGRKDVASDLGFLPGCRREVALVRHGNELLAQAECVADLGCTWEERDDPHSGILSVGWNRATYLQSYCSPV